MKDGIKVQSVSIVEAQAAAEQLSISSWSPVEADALYVALEHPNWAPWLEASVSTLAGRALVFPHGQLVIKDMTGEYAASLSTNQIFWDGDVCHLPSWDVIAGEPPDYSQTYNLMGNTLVMMSVNVAPAWKGKHMPAKLVSFAKDVAKYGLGLDHLIVSLRPSGFGKVKQEMGYDLDFEQYCWSVNENGQPLDPWIRSLSWSGLKLLAVNVAAMTVQVPVDEFKAYKIGYKPDAWVEVVPGIWECQEVGVWTVDDTTGVATYVENNVWGEISLP